jgi:hypothetical protein
VKSLSEYKVKRIFYFEKPGAQNTSKLVSAVKERVKENDVKYVVVASVTGHTALRVAEKLNGLRISVICVSGFPGWGIYHGVEYPFVKGEIREKLKELNVSILDRMPSTLSGDTIDYGLARYGYIPASWVVAETLEAVGGYGMKTAVEAVLMSTDSGVVPPSVNIISIAGSDRGADTAIVARTTFSSLMFSRDSAQRFQIMEIIAMPRVKKWYKTIGVGEVFIKEIEKGEVLKPSPESV